MVTRPSLGQQGFTLLEALVAMVLSTIVVSLVTSTFLAQNRFYSDAINRSAIQESVRGATSRAAADFEAAFRGGVVVADRNEVVYRLPLLLGAVCGVKDQSVFVFLPRDDITSDPSSAAGFGIRAGDLDWRYKPAAWGSFYHSSGGEAARACAASGADTTGATPAFTRMEGLDPSGNLTVGDLVMVYQEVELRLAPSNLDPGTRALFRGPVGGTLTEVATGLSNESSFEYGLFQRGDFRRRVRGSRNLARIDRIRLFLESTAPASGAGRNDLTFDLTRTVPLRNVN